MEKRIKIILVRHGQSIGNATRTILGHTDLDLTELGYKQAEATAKHLKDVKIDKIYSSDLKRAYNTAVPHAKIRNMEIITDENLRELYLGLWENLKVEELIGKWGREAFEVDWHGNFGTFTFPEGESVQAGGKRFYDEIVTICKENEGKTLLICAHAAVIRAFWAIICSIPWEKVATELPFPSNASYSLAYYDGSKIVPEKYSCDEHLSEVGITKVISN